MKPAEEPEAGRPKRAISQPASYAEPSLSSKLRQGDTFFEKPTAAEQTEERTMPPAKGKISTQREEVDAAADASMASDQNSIGTHNNNDGNGVEEMEQLYDYDNQQSVTLRGAEANDNANYANGVLEPDDNYDDQQLFTLREVEANDNADDGNGALEPDDNYHINNDILISADPPDTMRARSQGNVVLK